jgi:CBS domain-containing protein
MPKGNGSADAKHQAAIFFMQYEQFVGQVQHRAELSSRSQAVAAVRSTLETLSERLAGGEAREIAAQLPKEIGRYLQNAWEGQTQRFSLQEFYLRVSVRADLPLPRAIQAVRSVFSVLNEAVSPGEIEDLKAQLPAEFHVMFEPVTESFLKRGVTMPEPTRIRDIETHHPEVVFPDTSLMEAAQKMKHLDIGMLPVCEGQYVVGMITDRDITIRATAEGKDPRSSPVREAMTEEVICCYEDQEIQEAARIMEEKQIRRLPVIDRERSLVGVVSLGDLAVRQHNERLAGEVLGRVSEHPMNAPVS